MENEKDPFPLHLVTWWLPDHLADSASVCFQDEVERRAEAGEPINSPALASLEFSISAISTYKWGRVIDGLSDAKKFISGNLATEEFVGWFVAWCGTPGLRAFVIWLYTSSKDEGAGYNFEHSALVFALLFPLIQTLAYCAPEGRRLKTLLSYSLGAASLFGFVAAAVVPAGVAFQMSWYMLLMVSISTSVEAMRRLNSYKLELWADALWFWADELWLRASRSRRR